MSLSLTPDLFLLPFEKLDGEGDDPETLDPSDPADPLPDGGGDDFFIGRRGYASGSNEFSRARPLGQEGLRIVCSDSETDTDEQIVAIGDTPLANDTDLPFRWECLPAEENWRDSMDDFEWEDVPIPEEEEVDFQRRNFEWEFLLSVNNMGRNSVESVHGEDQEGFDYASEYEILFDQFVDNGGPEWMKCCRPAAKSVVENLPSVLLTAEDVAKNNTRCAICRDEISLTVKVKRLPCLHHYHEYCILPWLVVRNTCPLCRYEFPSSDASEEEAQARDDFEILQASSGGATVF